MRLEWPITGAEEPRIEELDVKSRRVIPKSGTLSATRYPIDSIGRSYGQKGTNRGYRLRMFAPPFHMKNVTIRSGVSR